MNDARIDVRPFQPHDRVADVLRRCDRASDVFSQFGLAWLCRPIPRRTIARGVSVAQAAAARGVPLDRLLASLNSDHVNPEAHPSACLADETSGECRACTQCPNGRHSHAPSAAREVCS